MRLEFAPMDQDTLQSVREALSVRAAEMGVFDQIEQVDGLLRCHAMHVEEPAWYQVGPFETIDGADAAWVGMYTPNRWLSESVEADVLHMGDKFEDLLEEELIDQGLDERLPVQHFRDDEKVFVFRSAVKAPLGQRLDGPACLEELVKTLAAYEACFRELGDMTPDEDDL